MPGGSATQNILIVPAPSDEAMHKARLVVATHSKNNEDLRDLLEVLGL